ncbi:unnamed protein product [Ostreobium quekettii]|uniref:Pre-mRNA-splicing factor 38 n=1 Tax=Ostreobium quekettii TaxID=121088 RepID=A0A8S1JFN7_9CHLO|nr:unnamed protein product [Ostreobium quekettii]
MGRGFNGFGMKASDAQPKISALGLADCPCAEQVTELPSSAPGVSLLKGAGHGGPTCVTNKSDNKERTDYAADFFFRISPSTTTEVRPQMIVFSASPPIRAQDGPDVAAPRSACQHRAPHPAPPHRARDGAAQEVLRLRRGEARAPESVRASSGGVLKGCKMEQHGNKTTFNMENVLRQNIINSEYFRDTCMKLGSWEEIVDEIYYNVDHVEPWMSGNARGASTAFCLLYRLFMMKLTVRQVKELIMHNDSVYIRAIGFLYLRYVGDPKTLWSWYEPHLEDDQEMKPSPLGSAITLGDFVIDIFLGQVALLVSGMPETGRRHGVMRRHCCGCVKACFPSRRTDGDSRSKEGK